MKKYTFWTLKWFNFLRLYCFTIGVLFLSLAPFFYCVSFITLLPIVFVRHQLGPCLSNRPGLPEYFYFPNHYSFCHSRTMTLCSRHPFVVISLESVALLSPNWLRHVITDCRNTLLLRLVGIRYIYTIEGRKLGINF